MHWNPKHTAIATELIEKHKLPANFMHTVQTVYAELCTEIIKKVAGRPLLVSINGAQGTGKSTLVDFLKQLLGHELSAPIAALSLDDFYLTRAQRQLLADTRHPLLATRGVPGTHDLELMDHCIKALLEQHPTRVPTFDKAIDDRLPESAWQAYPDAVKVVLFEGWCNSSPWQDDEQLSAPINQLEREEDPQGSWRQFANTRLKEYHQRIFEHADLTLMLKAPSFDCIFAWRELQERKLKAATPADKQSAIMDQAQLKRFIQHYERISRHTLAHLPESADIVIPVGADHSIQSLVINYG